jgi:potassium-transporting ATPase KdpC subunit
MLRDLIRAGRYTLVTMALFGGAYQGVVWGVGRAVFAPQAEGSLIRSPDGTVLGSSLVAQKFSRPEYFHPRPSAVDYNAASTGGSNYGPSNPDHLRLVRERLEAVVAREGVRHADVPSEMVTASGSGLDPHIPPAAANLQAARVARARSVDVNQILELVRTRTEEPLWGVFGGERVNVLELNLALDERLAPHRAGSEERR